MKRIFFLAICIIWGQCVFAQGMYGIEAGLSAATIRKSRITPAAEGYYLLRCSRTFYIGPSLFLERFSFKYHNNIGAASASYGDILSVDQKSTYLFLAPKLDVGIGYRKYWHASFAAGPGMLLGGRQFTNKLEPFWSTPAVYGRDTATFYTLYNIPLTKIQYRLGVSRRIPTRSFWNIMVSFDYTYLPGHISVGPLDLRSSAYCFTIGIMHKYPQVLIED